MVEIAYLSAALCCLAVAVLEFRRRTAIIVPLLWLAFAFLLLVLGINRYNGFLGIITDIFRQQAKAGGWYRQRQVFQKKWLRRVPYLGFAGFGALLIMAWRNWLRLLPAIIALLYFVCYAVVEGISFHNIDWELHQHWHGLLIRTWGDLLGVGLTFFAAIWITLWRPKRPAAAMKAVPAAPEQRNTAS